MERSPAPTFRERARSFWFASRFLPRDSRAAVAGLYAFARMVDDLVDEGPPAVAPADVARLLGDWRRWLAQPDCLPPPDRAIADPLRLALVHHGVPATYLQLLIDGVSSDLSRRDVRAWPELRAYCIQVASSVGLAMCHLLGAGGDPLARAAAIDLGIAMQLTNILRDVGPDLHAGRVYLPADDLVAHGYSRERLAWLAARVAGRGSGAIDHAFRDVMRLQIDRARQHYARGLEGVWRLPPDCRLAILVAGRLYRAILDEIEAARYDVFSRRAATSTWHKSAEAVRSAISVRAASAGISRHQQPRLEQLATELRSPDELVLLQL